MTDDISKVVREMRDSCNTVGCGGRHGYCDLHLWADRLESATTPAEVDAPGIDTANHAGVRVRGYTVEQYATLARQLAEAEAGLRAILDARRYRTDGGLADLVNRCRSMSQEDEAVIAAGAANVAEYKSLAEATRRLGEVEAYRDATFDGNAVYAALDDRAKLRTSAENVADVLDALNRVAQLASDSEGGE